jgi:hypothetical protein
MKSPLNCKALMRSGAVVLEFVMVMVWYWLVVPTFAEKVVIVVGETVTGTANTVSTSAGDVTPLKLAVMLLVPTPTPVAKPPEAIVATEVVTDAHVTEPVRFCVLVSL